VALDALVRVKRTVASSAGRADPQARSGRHVIRDLPQCQTEKRDGTAGLPSTADMFDECRHDHFECPGFMHCNKTGSVDQNLDFIAVSRPHDRCSPSRKIYAEYTIRVSSRAEALQEAISNTALRLSHLMTDSGPCVARLLGEQTSRHRAANCILIISISDALAC